MGGGMSEEQEAEQLAIVSILIARLWAHDVLSTQAALRMLLDSGLTDRQAQTTLDMAVSDHVHGIPCSTVAWYE